MRKYWTPREEKYLMTYWGKSGTDKIAKALGRSVMSVIKKRERMGLENKFDAMNEISLCDISRAVFGNRGGMYNYIRYYADFPVKRRCVNTSVRLTMRIKDFWEWAEIHREALNLSKMEPMALGPEPDWVDAKRKDDYKKNMKQKPWSEWELATVKNMLEKGESYLEIARMLRRSVVSIRYAALKANTKYRPVKAQERKIKDADREQVKELIDKGYKLEDIMEKMGLSERGVRFALVGVFGTSKTDTCRDILRKAT